MVLTDAPYCLLEDIYKSVQCIILDCYSFDRDINMLSNILAAHRQFIQVKHWKVLKKT